MIFLIKRLLKICLKILLCFVVLFLFCAALLSTHQLLKDFSFINLNRPALINLKSPPPIPQNSINIASYNIAIDCHYQNTKHSWDNRKKAVLALLQDKDIIALQEVSINQLKDIKALLPYHALIAYHSPAGKLVNELSKGIHPSDEMLVIAYKNDRFVGAESSIRWLSETPTRSSIAKGASSFPRIIMSVHLRDKLTNKTFYVFNSHYDHKSSEAKRTAIKVESDFIKETVQSEPWFSLGDRNYFEDAGDEKIYQDYLKILPARDFRDGTKYGHFGEATTFVGFENDPHKAHISFYNEAHISFFTIETKTLDVGFYSHRHVDPLWSYSISGDYNITERNFASDHFMIGGVFILK